MTDRSSGPAGRPPEVVTAASPFKEFFHSAAAGGVLLIAAALVALVWANSPWQDSYTALFQAPTTIGIGEFSLTKPLLLWINDALMAIFFLVVGVEIKRELLVGELNSVRKAALPMAAAAGGAILPAIIFILVVGGGPGSTGWGIPMATDIAFALGVLALVGNRVPLGLRIFLTALAIVDDLMAVVVIAVFYTDALNVAMLAGAGVVLAVLIMANRAGIRHPVVYTVLGAVLWVFVLKSGVHATIAGVLLAATIPARVSLDASAFVARARRVIDRFEHRVVKDHAARVEDDHEDLWELEAIAERAQAPMIRLEHRLHPWVAFLIVPLFALANAGVTIPPGVLSFPPDPIILGVFLGLVLGKQVGITVSTWLVVRSGRAVLPVGVTWRHIYGVAWLGGIGFTMSLFIAELGLDAPEQLAMAKVGILLASIVGGGGGFLLLRTWASRGLIHEHLANEPSPSGH